MAAEQGVKATEAGEAITTEAGEAIRQLGERLAQSADSAQQILASAQQQLTGVDQVAMAMQNIREASTQNMAATRQVEQAARELDGLSKRLTDLVGAERAARARRSRGRMPRRDAELMARLLATFQVEADEHLVALRRHLLELAGDASDAAARELVETTFRDMHTLKGAARSVGQRDVERVCASCEALLSALTRSDTPPGAAGRRAARGGRRPRSATLVAGERDGARRPARAPGPRVDDRAPRRRRAGACRRRRATPRPPPTSRHAPRRRRRAVRGAAPAPRRRAAAAGIAAARRPRRSGWPRTTSTRSCGAGRTCWRSSSPPTSGSSSAEALPRAAARAPPAPRTRWPRSARSRPTARTLVDGPAARPAVDRRRRRRAARAGAARADDARVERARPAAADGARPRAQPGQAGRVRVPPAASCGSTGGCWRRSRTR